jgi:phenylalanyl-tRNA synthetase beta chain
LVKEKYDFPESPVLAADLNIEAIAPLIPDRYYVSSVPVFPPVLEDLAFIVDENIQVQEMFEIMKSAGGEMVTEINLFDVYRGGQAGSGKKSLAFSLKYQEPDRTLTDKEVSRIRNKIIEQLRDKIGAELRS